MPGGRADPFQTGGGRHQATARCRQLRPGGAISLAARGHCSLCRDDSSVDLHSDARTAKHGLSVLPAWGGAGPCAGQPAVRRGRDLEIRRRIGVGAGRSHRYPGSLAVALHGPPEASAPTPRDGFFGPGRADAVRAIVSTGPLVRRFFQDDRRFVLAAVVIAATIRLALVAIGTPIGWQDSRIYLEAGNELISGHLIQSHLVMPLYPLFLVLFGWDNVLYAQALLSAATVVLVYGLAREVFTE